MSIRARYALAALLALSVVVAAAIAIAAGASPEPIGWILIYALFGADLFGPLLLALLTLVLVVVGWRRQQASWIFAAGIALLVGLPALALAEPAVTRIGLADSVAPWPQYGLGDIAPGALVLTLGLVARRRRGATRRSVVHGSA